jgi:MFS family permease
MFRCERVQIQLQNSSSVPGCMWEYNGLGLEYQILAGPSFIAVYAVAGLGWGYLADKYNRVNYLSLATLIFSVSIAGTAFANKYWHVLLFRMALAAG